MKKLFIILVAVTATIAMAQNPKFFRNKAQDQDVQLCANDGGVEKCPVRIDGDTGNTFISGDMEVTGVPFGGNPDYSRLNLGPNNDAGVQHVFADGIDILAPNGADIRLGDGTWGSKDTNVTISGSTGALNANFITQGGQVLNNTLSNTVNAGISISGSDTVLTTIASAPQATYLAIFNYRFVVNDDSGPGFLQCGINFTGTGVSRRMLWEGIPGGVSTDNIGGSVSWVITTTANANVELVCVSNDATDFDTQNDANGVPELYLIRLGT